MSFLTWLLAQTGRDDHIGELAVLISEDDCWPRVQGSGLQSYYSHLMTHPHMTKYADTLFAAYRQWTEFRHAQKRTAISA